MNTEEEVLKDLESTIRFIKDKGFSYGFPQISPVYLFTNEYIREYIKHFNLRDKKVLTVTASGDQVIVTMLKGAKQIDTFDCNKLTYYHLFFKIGAIKALTLQEFLNLYDLNVSNKKELYQKIRDYIVNDDIKIYWDSFFENYNDYYFKMFFLGYPPKYSIHKNINYLDETVFYKAKSIVHENVKFKNILLKDISSAYRNKKFDFINLSNIIDYENLDVFVQSLKSILNNNLDDKGIILASYIWNKINSYDMSYRALLKNNCNPSILQIKTDQLNSNYSNHSLILCKK